MCAMHQPWCPTHHEIKIQIENYNYSIRGMKNTVYTETLFQEIKKSCQHCIQIQCN